MGYTWVYFFNNYSWKKNLNRSVDIRCLTVAFNMSLWTVKLQLGLSYRNAWINWSLLWNKICLLIFLALFRRVCLGMWKLGQWRKRCVNVSVSFPQAYNGFRVSGVSWKQCLIYRLPRWLRPKRNPVRSLIPYGLWISKILFAQTRIKVKVFFLEFLIFQ